MLLTVFCVPKGRAETTFALDVSPEFELRDFVALCELESGIPAAEIQVFFAEQPLRDLTRALGNYGLKDGDVVVLRQAERRPAAQPAIPGLPRIDFSSISVPGTSSSQPSTQAQPPRAAQTHPPASPAISPQGMDNPALLREMLLANPHELSLLKERNPPLAEALLSGDLERFTKVLLEQQQDRAKREQERIRLFTADPFDLDAQAKIEEDIRQHNIEENMNIAMEEAPESFGQVVMLYINCKVNGHPVKAFVDSGAQMTIMSQACAERCNIMRLVDRRWAGIAKGVGTQKIIGRVHLAQVQIEGDFLPCSFSILEDQPMDMLLGLDMLKRHQCSIDLKKSVLVIGTTGTETRFLSEAELPDCARLAYGPTEGREDSRPEEMADRELAEALQKSIQDSETSDGKTTSPHSLPLSLCKSGNDPSPSSSGTSHSRSLTLDRSKSSPASLQQSPPLEGPFSSSQTQGESSSCLSDTHDMTEHHSAVFKGPESSVSLKVAKSSQNPHCGQVDATEPMFQPMADTTLPNNGAPTLPTQEQISSTVLKDNDVTDFMTCRESNANTPNAEEIILQKSEEMESPFNDMMTNSTTDVCTQEVDMVEISSSQNPDQVQDNEQGSIGENISNGQEDRLSEWTMHHNVPGPDGTTEPALEQNMERAALRSLASERDQLEVVPSLTQALKELHNLLMSNTQTCRTSPPPAFHIANGSGVNRDPAGEGDASLNRNMNSSSSTATDGENTFEPDSLKRDSTAEEMTVTSQEQEDHQSEEFENVSQEVEPHCSPLPEANAGGETTDGPTAEMEEASLLLDQPLELPENGMNSDHEPFGFVEPFEEHCSSVAADSSNLEFSHSLHDSSLATHPTADSTQLSTLNLMGQYPAEHIQRIQAAGFSAHEATEALELAEGSVELALLLLLARKITVPI